MDGERAALMDWTMIGWREGIFILVVLIVAYILGLLVKLTRVGRSATAGTEPPRMPPTIESTLPLPPSTSSPEPERTAVPTTSPALHFEWDDVDDVLGGAPKHQAPATSLAHDAQRAGGFGEHLAEHLARSETELEVRRLRQEIEDLRAELEELRAARRVSPQYAEAMELSQRGLTARDVADRLGISLAEAELVHALSRGDQDFDVGEDDGAERNAGNDEIDRSDGPERHRFG